MKTKGKFKVTVEADIALSLDWAAVCKAIKVTSRIASFAAMLAQLAHAIGGWLF